MLWTMILLACSQAPSEPAPEVGEMAHHQREAAHGAHQGHEGHKVGSAHHRFDDAEKWAEVFDDPERDAWQKPAELVAALGLQAGQKVADIGAGTGYLEPHLAEAVGADGAVVGIDIEPNLVTHMNQRFADAGISQASARLAEAADPKLADGEFDLVVLVDTYHHIEDRPGYFAKVLTGLAPGGRLVVVDFVKDADIPVGPPPEHRLSAEQVTQELTGAGWAAAGALDVLPYQYALVFTPAS